MVEFLLGVVVGTIGGMTLVAMCATKRKCTEIAEPKKEHTDQY